MNKFFKCAACFTLLWAHNAFAQIPVYQGGVVTPGHIASWTTTGVAQDGGSAASGNITSLGVTAAGPGICQNSASISSGAYQQLCLGVTTSGGATITLQNYGSAPAATLSFVVNGVTYQFPGALSQITIGITPVVNGTNGQCLYVSSGVVGQQTCQLSAITSLAGDGTATGPGASAFTLATVNANTGTFGSGSSIPVITVNGKGLITAVTTVANSLTIGSTQIVSGSSNTILYQNGTVLSELPSPTNSVMITSGGGVPSFSTTLPSSLVIPTPLIATLYGGNNAGSTLTLQSTSNGSPSGDGIFLKASTFEHETIAGSDILDYGVTATSTLTIAASPTNFSSAGTTSNPAITLGNCGTNCGLLAPATNELEWAIGGANKFDYGVTTSGQWTAGTTFNLAGTTGFSHNVSNSGTIADLIENANTGTGAQAQLQFGNSTSASETTLTLNGGSFSGGAGANSFVINSKASKLELQANGTDFLDYGISTSGVLTFPAATTISTGTLVLSGLSSGTCSSGLGLNASNQAILVSCPGAASSIQVGTTTINSATASNYLLGTGTVSAGSGTLANYQVSTGLTITSSALSVTNPVTATVPQVCDIISTSATTCNNGGSAANNGTYTTPSGTVWLDVKWCGGGGGGGAGGSSPGSPTAGNTTTFGSSLFTGNGGGAGQSATGSDITGGAGGTSSGGFQNISGQSGGPAPGANIANQAGGTGGDSAYYGGGGYPGVNATTIPPSNATANTGGGGGGAGSNASISGGSGGGAGGCGEGIITSPSSSYSYVVGATAAGASAGTGGSAGGNGAAGRITVTAHFNY